MTAEQQERLERLKAAVKVISNHEDALGAALDADVRAPPCLKEPWLLPSCRSLHSVKCVSGRVLL